jgi:hypothetical protein
MNLAEARKIITESMPQDGMRKIRPSTAQPGQTIAEYFVHDWLWATNGPNGKYYAQRTKLADYMEADRAAGHIVFLTRGQSLLLDGTPEHLRRKHMLPWRNLDRRTSFTTARDAVKDATGVSAALDDVSRVDSGLSR